MPYWLLVVSVACYVALFSKYSFQVETDWTEVFSHRCPQRDNCDAKTEVMKTLTTLSEYKVWNTFVKDINSHNSENNIHEGDDIIRLTVNIRDPITRKMIILNLPFKMGTQTDSKLCWHYQLVPIYLQPYILSTNRCIYLRSLFDPGTLVESVQIKHIDENIGPLAPLINALYYSSIYEGFEQMTSDLAAHLRNV